MKKNFRFAFVGAIALLGAVGISSCSSSSDEVIDNPDYDPTTNSVKTQFAISLPPNVNALRTRMSEDAVQKTDNSFRGMKDITLIPFIEKPTAASATQAGAPITLGTIAASGDLKNFTSSTVNYKVFPNVKVPLGTAAFLFYAQANTESGSSDFQNGKTVMKDPTTAGTAGYTFEPSQIYDGLSNPVGDKIATYLTNIAKAEGWSALTSGGLKTLYDQFIKITAGSSFAAQRAVSDLFNEIKGNTDAVSTAILAAIRASGYGIITGTGSEATLTFDTSLNGYPANLNLPDGAAAVKWDNTNKKFDVDDSGTTVASLTSYVYPASLWYTVNTGIKVSNTKQADASGAYPEKTSWDDATDGVLSLYTDGAAVTPTTRSIALVNTIQYAVGRLDITVKCASATLYDHNGTAVNVPEGGFPVSAVLIGGQKAVDFTFSNPSGTTTYTIYDKEVSGMNAKNGTAEGSNYTLALETAANTTAVNTDVHIAIELTNNTGADFYGKGGQLIPKDGKFYLTATLTAENATETGKKVFKQDYYTKADLTIQAGTIGTNTVGLGAATNTIPDLRTPTLELGMSVDLHWLPGHTFSINL